MSINGKKEKSKSNTVVTPNNPSWVTNSVQNYTTGLDSLGRSDPYSYVAKANPLLKTAQNAAMGLNLGQGPKTGNPAFGKGNDPYLPEINGGEGDGFTSPSAGGSQGFDYFGSAGKMALGAGMAGPSYADARGYSAQGYDAAGAQAGKFTDADMGAYMNPYQRQVVDAYTADANAASDRALSEQSRMAALNGGSRNSNNAIAAGVLGGELSRARASGLGDILYRGYDQAANLVRSDLDRSATVGMFNAGQSNDAARFGAGARNDAARYGADAFNTNQQFNAGQRDNALTRALTASGLLGNLGTAQGQDVRQNIGLLSDLGGQQQGIDQATAQAPLTLQQILGGLYGDMPYGLFNGSTTTGNTSGSSLGFSADLSKLMAMMPKSDVRAKVDIVPLGEGPGGLPQYEFSYADDPSGTRYVGPMAQEVEQVMPQAVGMAPDGMKTVDYNAVGHMTPDQQDQSGLSAMRTRAAQTGSHMAANDTYPMPRRRGLFGGNR